MAEERTPIDDGGDDWVSTLVAEAGTNNPLVTGGALARIKEMLAGQFTEKELSSAKLKEVSRQLIGDMFLNQSEATDSK